MKTTTATKYYIRAKYEDQPAQIGVFWSKKSEAEVIKDVYQYLNNASERANGMVLESVSPASEEDYIRFTLVTRLEDHLTRNN